MTSFTDDNRNHVGVSEMSDHAAHSAADSDTTSRRFASAAHDAIDSAANSAEKVERKVRKGVADANETFEKSHEAASDQIRQSVDSLESFVQKRPVAAAGIAFAAGALATVLLRR